jgi:hypothetical protein
VTAYVGYDAYRARGGYALATAVASGQRSAEEVIKALSDSGLRGLGGAVFRQGANGASCATTPRPG